MGKTITGSVGQGGINSSKDVATIQYLLNCVPASKGGPMSELAVDGVNGPKTVAAIKAFQKANFPFSDGRVDAGKQTLAALQSYDPNPAAPIGLGAKGAGHKDVAVKTGYKDAAHKNAEFKTGYKDAGHKDAGFKTGYKEAGFKDAGYKDAGGKMGYKEAPGGKTGFKESGGFKSLPGFKQ